MVIIAAAADLLIMIGFPVILFVLHRLFPEALENRKSLILTVLAAWFAYTFVGSRLVAGESMIIVAYSGLIVAVLASIMVLVLKYLPDQAQRYNQQFRFGFMAAAAAAMIVGWRLCA